MLISLTVKLPEPSILGQIAASYKVFGGLRLKLKICLLLLECKLFSYNSTLIIGNFKICLICSDTKLQTQPRWAISKPSENSDGKQTFLYLTY